MKKLLIVSFILISICSFSQTKKLDPKLFGSWTGSEKDNQVKGMSKSWIMHRFDNGDFVLLFTAVEDGEVSNFSEKGKWWIDEKGVFNELHFVSGKTDKYSYVMLDENNVKFKAVQLSIIQENSNYEFIDTKLDKELLIHFEI